MTDNRTFRNASRVITVECPSHDYRAGVKYDTTTRVGVSSIEMKSQKTKRWKRVWSARAEGSLRIDVADTPRLAICRCLAMNPHRRPKWLPDVVRKVEGK